MFGGVTSTPPLPPPPLPNPPTFASSQSTPPMAGMPSIYTGLGNSILTSPIGAGDERSTRFKSLLGQ